MKRWTTDLGEWFARVFDELTLGSAASDRGSDIDPRPTPRPVPVSSDLPPQTPENWHR